MRLLSLTLCLLAFAVPPHICADELSKAPPGSFSIAVIPDTQHYRGRGTKGEPTSQVAVSNPTFRAYVDWIADNLDRQRSCSSHTSEISLTRTVTNSGVSQGNVWITYMARCHTASRWETTTWPLTEILLCFNGIFRVKGFVNSVGTVGCFETPQGSAAVSGNNANSFQLVSAGGMDFLFLHLECNAPDDVLHWASDVLQRYSDRRALVTTHMGLGPRDKPKTSQDYFEAPKGRMTWIKRHGKRGNSPQEMWDKCFRKHSNLFMICCGDQSRTQALRQESRGDHGNIVHELLSDYGIHGLRLMTFIPNADRIEVKTWNPLTGETCESTSIVPTRSQHQFELTYQMLKPKR